MTEYEFDVANPPANAGWSPVNSRERTDGHTATVSMWKGLALGETGFLTIAAELKDQQHTERSGYDMRQQYALVNGAFDPRELTYNRFNSWYGEPELKQATVFANMGGQLGDGGSRWYGWASYQQRDARSAGFIRPSRDDRNIVTIYPDGFLPIIAPGVDDYAATGGVTWSLGDWDMDTSLGYGKNEMRFIIENTLNRSIGPTSRTTFDSGGFAYDQLVFNISGTRQYEGMGFESPLNVAVGAEARREGYKLFAGEPDSYRYGGVTLANGSPAAPGAQVFPGFQPKNATSENRSAVGVFADFEANVTKNLLASFALRAEHYSDFGSNLSGKLAGRYDFTPMFGLRGSVQNGFRAPSPQQQNFTATSTNFINGVPFEITTFKPTDPVAASLGAKPLDAEKSVNASFGAVLRSGKASLTIDAYHIKIKDRIILSENLTQPNVRAFLTAQGFIGIGGGRFFINGVDTTTKGLDIVANWPVMTGIGKFDYTIAANFTDTSVDKVPVTAQLAALNPAPPLFDRVNVLSLERGQPKNKLNGSVTWTSGQWGATLRATRYGEVLSPGTTAALDFTMSPKTVVDLEARFAVNKQLNLALGADNVFDEYPDAVPVALNTTGNTPFSNYAPFGRSGRYVYGRLSYAF